MRTTTVAVRDIRAAAVFIAGRRCAPAPLHAAAVASLILITEATVTDEPKDTTIEEAISQAAAQGGQGGGMY